MKQQSKVMDEGQCPQGIEFLCQGVPPGHSGGQKNKNGTVSVCVKRRKWSKQN